MENRDLCPTCNEKPLAVNYIRKGVTHYRSQCDSCIRKGRKLKPLPPMWFRRGYKKKPQCEQCGFKLRFPDQSVVYHVDGNLSNNDYNNLKTVCLNCRVALKRSKLAWKQASIIPDF